MVVLLRVDTGVFQAVSPIRHNSSHERTMRSIEPGRNLNIWGGLMCALGMEVPMREQRWTLVHDDRQTRFVTCVMVT